MDSQSVKSHVLKTYEERTTKSKAHNEKASHFLPGGDTRSIGYYSPYPIFGNVGKGCYLYDYDGNEYIDFVNNMTSLVNGHAHPHVVAAVSQQLQNGTVHGIPSEAQYKLAEIICNRVPSIEKLRFTNSGTEATLFAMRAARAFTGKQKFIKMDGGYHGSHDHVQVNVFPDMTATDRPVAYVGKGGSTSVVDDMLIAPYNDLTVVEELFIKNIGSVAAIIVEPILGSGGSIYPTKGYLKGLRELADRFDALLIFDEVISFRAHFGGMQSLENVIPDLTALGKVIGGGFPVGAFGGREDIMDVFNPKHEDAVTHSGTFTGNAMTMVAGLANMEIFGQKEFDQLNALGAYFADKINQKITQSGIKGRYEDCGSFGMVRFTDQQVLNSQQAMTAYASYKDFLDILHIEMLNRGVFFMSRGMFILSTPMTIKDIDNATDAIGEALLFLKPVAVEMGLCK